MLLSLISAGCAPPLGADDALPKGARRVAVPRRLGLELHEHDFCAWACGLAQRPGEKVVTCRKLHIDPTIDELRAHREGYLCVFR